jgi:uncharacterized protein (TIGR03067 family)
MSSIFDVPEAAMGDDNSGKMGLVTAVIGAAGAILAAVIPALSNRPAADPASAVGKADPAHAVTKPVGGSGPKGTADGRSKAGGPGDGSRSKGAGAATRTPKSEHKTLPHDLAQMQGEWAIQEQTIANKHFTDEELARTKSHYEFDGDKLAIRNHGDSPGQVYYQGRITLHPDRSPRGFDFAGKDRNGRACEMVGIYAFDGPVLMLRFQVHQVGDGGKPPRPDSPGSGNLPKSGFRVHLRRAAK